MRSKIREYFLMLSAVFATIMGGGMASAIEAPVSLSENPNSPQVIMVTRDVYGVVNPVSNMFNYSLEPVYDYNPAEVDGLPGGFVIDFNAIEPDEYKTASQSIELDLGSLVFTEVGDYKFVLREMGSSNYEVYPVDTDNEYYIVVSVRNEIQNGVPTGRLIPTLALQVLNSDEGIKTDAIFSSNAQLTYVQITKNVEGNLARRDEYFKFVVDFPGAADGDVFTVVGQDAEVNYHGEIINTQNTIVVGETNAIYLKHGQVVWIGTNGESTVEIPIGTEFSVAEEASNNYIAWLDGNQINSGQYTLVADDFSIDPVDSVNRADFVNVKEASVLTGIVVNTWPFAVIAVMGGISVVLIRKTMIAKK